MQDCNMNGRVLLVVVRYLVIAVALLHASRGARPRLQVIYGLNGVDNQNELECYDGNTLIQSGARFTFRDPDRPEQMGETFVAERSSYPFTTQPSNESLVSCRFDDSPDSEESDRVMVAAIPQYTAGIATIRQYYYSDTDVVEIKCPFPLGRLSSLYQFSWERVVGEVGAPIRNDTRGVYWLAEEYNRILHVNISAAPDRSFICVGVVQTCTGTSSCGLVGRDSPPITIITIDYPIVNVSIAPEARLSLTQNTLVFTCTATWADNLAPSGYLITEWKVDGIRYGSSRCEQDVTLCNITMSTDKLNQDQTIELTVNTNFINTSEQFINTVCTILNYLSIDTISGLESRLPFTTINQSVQFVNVCSELSDPQGGNVSYTDTIIGSTAIYQCTSPLQLSVQSTPNILYERNCTNEGWTGEAPNCTCRKLDEPQGGTVVYSNNQDIDSVATYLCNESSQIMGSVMCNASILGWNRTGKTCECLTSPEGGMLQFTDFLFIGSKATYTCTNSVTGAIGGQTRQCRDGRWDREPYPCFCEKLSGMIEYSMDNRSVGSVATYTDFKCGIEQEISGDTTRTCSGTGWDGVRPTCKLTTVAAVFITVLATITASITVAVIYVIVTQCRKRKSKRELLYDVPYNYELPPLPPRIGRMESGIYDTISNGSNDGPQNQPQALQVENISQCEHISQDRIVLPGSEVPAASMSPPSDENDNTVNDTVVSQFPPATSPDAIISARSDASSCMQLAEIDLSSERANGSDLLLDLKAGVTTNEPTAETQNDEFRTPRTKFNITANVSYQPSTNFDFERNPAYRTNVAIAPEIETRENIAYEHSESNISASSIGDDESTIDSDRQS